MSILDFLIGKPKKEEQQTTPSSGGGSLLLPSAEQAPSPMAPDDVADAMAKKFFGDEPKYKSTFIRTPTKEEAAAAPVMSPLQEKMKKSQMDIVPEIERSTMVRNDAANLRGTIDSQVFDEGSEDELIQALVNRRLTARYEASEGRGALTQAMRQAGAEAIKTIDILTPGSLAKVSPENEIKEIDAFLQKYAPDQLEKAKMIDVSSENQLARAAGSVGEAVFETLIPAGAAVKAVRAVPWVAKMRTAGRAGIYAANILENAAAQVAATSSIAFTKQQDKEEFMRNLVASPSVLLPFGFKAEIAVAPVADYLAAKALGMSEGDAVMNAAMGLVGAIPQRSGVAAEIRNLDIVREQAENIVAQAKYMRSDPFAIQKLYDDAAKKIGDVMGENRMLAKADVGGSAQGESRLIGATGPREFRPEELQSTKKPEPSIPDILQGRAPKDALPPQESTPLSRSQESASQSNGQAKPLDEIVLEFESKTPVNEKITLLDYIRTPSKVLEKIGLGKEAEALRYSYDRYAQALPIEIDKVTQWSQMAGNAPDVNERIFKYLDGQSGVELNVQEQHVATEIQSYLKTWADKLGLGDDRRISNYITHIFEDDITPQINALEKKMRRAKDPKVKSDIQAELDNLRSSREFPDDLARILSDEVAGSVYNPFLLRRKGKRNYKMDTWAALDAYIKRATRKYYMDPALAEVKKASLTLEESQFDYIKSYIDKVNMRPSKFDKMMDNTIKNFFGYRFGDRPTAAISRTMRRWIYRGTLGGNVGSAVKNLTQVSNTYAKLGERYTLSGYTQFAKNRFDPRAMKELETSGIFNDSFIQDRTISATKKFWQNVDDKLFYFFQEAERINRGAAYYGAKSKAMKSMGMNEEAAIKYAKELVAETQFRFDPIDTPVVLGSDAAKTILQFQSYTVKQTEFLAEMLKSKDFAGLGRYIGSSMVIYLTIGEALGLDPVDMLIPPKRVLQEGKLTPPTMQLPQAIFQTATGAKDQFGRKAGPKNMVNAIVSLLPAGVQTKKTLQGLQAAAEGEVRSQSGKTKLFDVKQDPKSILKTIVFGKYSTKEAHEYFKSREGKTALEYFTNLLEQSPTENTGLPPLPDLPTLPPLPDLPSL